MSNIKDEILLNDFGLDTDSAQRYMAKGSSPYFLNVLKGEDGSYGELTNIKGNRKITYELGGANTYFVLGSCYDGLTRNVYYFIFSQPSDITGSGDFEYDNRLVRFNEDSEEIDTIFYDTKNYFGLDPTKPMRDPFVLGDWLYFNPRESEPKMISISMALLYTWCLKEHNGGEYSIYDPTKGYLYGFKVSYFGGIFLANTTVAVGETPVTASTKWDRIGDCYQNETDLGENPYYDSEFRYAFNVIKHIPVKRPICIYATNLDHHANNVRGKLFRFSHRYKYFDNSYSRYSAFSDITLPQYDEYYNGETPASIDVFNCIDVIVPLHSASLIKEIDIVFQETGGDWKRAKVVNRQDITLLDQINYTHRFYNTDSAYEVIDDTYFNEPHDSVPKKANSQEIINKNILCYGGCTEGFPNIDKNDIDVSLTPEMIPITISEEGATLGRRRDNIASGDVYVTWSGIDWMTWVSFTSWFPTYGIAAGDIYIITLNEKTATYIIQPADVVMGVLTASLANFLTVNFNLGLRVTYGATFFRIAGSINLSVSVFYEPAPGVSKVALTKATGFKTGAWHPFCIYYYDANMRRWDAQTSKDLPDGTVAWEILGTTVYVPMLGEISPNAVTTANKWNINWEVNHLPPEGAKWWRWGYAGNALCSEFVQYIISAIEDSSPWTRMNIAPLQTLKFTTTGTWNQFPQSIIEAYSWQKGDRVRIITEESAPTELGVVVDGVYDYEILKYEEDDTVTPTAYWIYVQDFNYATALMGEDSLVEIYRPIKTDTAKIFYEFGELMPIIEDSSGELVHGCGVIGTADQNSLMGTPATGVFRAGDVYHILRTPSKPIDSIEGYFHESHWYSDFYTSDDWDKGRIGVETNYGERDLNIVRYSDQYLQNTLINGMPTFHGMNYKEFTNTYGEIMRIIEIGDTLKVYQRKKPSSVLIGKTQYYDAEGNANVQAVSDRVMGSIRYSNTDYGTEFPESICRNNRYVYGYDIYNGVMWRDSPNGIFPISGRYESTDGGGDFKMDTYFKQKSKDLLVSGINGVSVLTVWDERHHNLYVIFKDAVTEANDEALIFHEPSNKWICFTNMDQTPAEGWNQILELDWSILWGFEGGIDYYFDEDIRFAVFGLLTPKSERVFPDIETLTLTVLDPSIVISSVALMGFNELQLQPLPVDVMCSFVSASVEHLGCAWNANYLDLTKNSIITGYPGVVLYSILDSSGDPITWLRVTNQYGVYYELGDTIPISGLGTTVYIYPTTENTTGIRTGYIRFRNTFPTIALATDIELITFAQATSPAPIVCSLLINAYVETHLTLTFGTATAIGAGSANVNLIFVPHHSSYPSGTVITVYWASYLTRAGVYTDEYVGAGSWSDITTGVANNKTIGLLYTLNAGDAVKTYLSVNIVDIKTALPDRDDVLLTVLTPTVICSSVSATNSPMTFLQTDAGIGSCKASVVTAVPAYCRLLSMPTWIRVVNSLGVELYAGDAPYGSTINDGATIRLYPFQANTGAPLIGEVILGIDTYGDSYTIDVYQNPFVSMPDGTGYIGSSANAGFVLNFGYPTLATMHFHIQCTVGSTAINLYSVTLCNPVVGDGEYFTAYWKAYIGGTDVYDGDGGHYNSGGTVVGYGSFLIANKVGTMQTVYLSQALLVVDVVTVYLSDMSIF